MMQEHVFHRPVYSKSKLIYGAGINDADYPVQPTVNERQMICLVYQTWKGMLQRCYDANFQKSNLTYIDCSVCDEWLTFSNFKRWMEKQDWRNKQLDNDLIVKGNKIYSPETCVFVDSMTNHFTTDSGATRGKWPIGAYFDVKAGKFKAQCSNPFTKKQVFLGYFTCQNEAHLAWKKRKHELACKLADLQTDERVANALRTRYL